LVERWDGSAWSVVPTPNQGSGINDFYAVTAASPDDIWGVGFYVDTTNGLNQTLTERFNPCTLTVTPTPSATSTPECPLHWGQVASANPSTGANELRGIATISANDIWAVGGYTGAGGNTQALLEHWNGSQWSVVAAPTTGEGAYLNAVDALSANDVWAAGEYFAPGVGTRTLMEHWDGNAWSVVASPNPGNYVDELLGVTIISSNDAWAVGEYQSTTTFIKQTLTMHWDGSSWSVVASPNNGSADNVLRSIAALSSNDIWSVGYSSGYRALALHWDGSSWTEAPTPRPGSGGEILYGVAAVANNDVWAVGAVSSAATWVLHWDGTAWSVFTHPVPPSSDSRFQAVTAISPADVWAVGVFTSGGYNQTLTEHWNGTVWSIVPSDTPGSFINTLYDVDAVSSTDVWASGTYRSSGDYTLIEHYPDPCSTATPSVTPSSTPTTPTTPATSATPTRTFTGTPSTATNTHTPTNTLTNTPTRTVTPLPTQTPGGFTATPQSTNTPTDTPTSEATVTPCVIQFTDVPQGSTFYTFIRCLACRGIINGYPDGTFRPNNNVTRGQLSKIVSNAAGFSDPQITQIFQDVPQGSTFFDFVGRLASRGYIGGYPCGNPEPCVPPENLPYFRPNNNATRGQISKIVSNAAGFSEPHTEQSFQDVPSGSTFYDFIERLASRGVIGGYACGGSGEPCVPPGNLPYFRPSANATRGQTSKIVANTFFPDCQTPSRQ
jgi:hypothetical protein